MERVSCDGDSTFGVHWTFNRICHAGHRDLYHRRAHYRYRALDDDVHGQHL